MTVKVCSSCSEVKDAENFVYNRLKCKSCYRKEANARYQKNKKVEKENNSSVPTRTFKENEILKREVERLKQELSKFTSPQICNNENKCDNTPV